MKLFLKIVMFVQILLIIAGVFQVFTGHPYYGCFNIILNTCFLGMNIINLKELNND